MTVTVDTSLMQTATIELTRSDVLALRAMAIRCTHAELTDLLTRYLPEQNAAAIARLLDTLAWASWNDLKLISNPQEISREAA